MPSLRVNGTDMAFVEHGVSLGQPISGATLADMQAGFAAMLATAASPSAR